MWTKRKVWTTISVRVRKTTRYHPKETWVTLCETWTPTAHGESPERAQNFTGVITAVPKKRTTKHETENLLESESKAKVPKIKTQQGRWRVWQRLKIKPQESLVGEYHITNSSAGDFLSCVFGKMMISLFFCLWIMIIDDVSFSVKLVSVFRGGQGRI